MFTVLMVRPRLWVCQCGLVMGFILSMVICTSPSRAQELAVIPALTAHVIDMTDTLDTSQKLALDDKLKRFEVQKGAQVVVLIVASTLPEDIFSYANRVGNTWKIGRKDMGDGLLLVVAKSDRKVRIEVAKSLEGAIPDLAARRIIDDAITPNFKAGNFGAGLNAATDQIMLLIRGEALPTPVAGESRNTGNSGFQWMDLAIFLFFAVPIGGRIARSVFGSKLGALITGGAVGAMALFVTASLLIACVAAFLALIVTLMVGGAPRMGAGAPGGWRGGSSGRGSWGSGSSGGGFSSGGGGNFGGGGASGGW